MGAIVALGSLLCASLPLLPCDGPNSTYEEPTYLSSLGLQHIPDISEGTTGCLRRERQARDEGQSPTSQQTTHTPESYSPFDDPFQTAALTADDEEDRQAKLNKCIEERYAAWQRSPYTDVSVLLLRWAADNLGVIDEVLRLEKVLRERFHFSTEQWDIPSEEPEHELTAKMLEFCKGKKKNDLLILYYAGHGAGGPEQCIWSATQSSAESPWLNWHKIQGHLLAHDPDVLLILDCCYSSLAAAVHSIGANWFLGSSVKESVALGVSWRSFTSAMVRQLELAANRYWDAGKKYNVQSLSHDLNFYEMDLLVSPYLLRLNRNDCLPTDLTPLLYPRQRRKPVSARSEPIASGFSQLPRGSVFSKPLRSDYATLPPTSIQIDQGFDGFTTIYDSSQASNNQPNFDVVFVHDLYGHPINTFANHWVAPTQGDRTIEECWPRDQLPRILKADGVYPRIITYGWPASSLLQPAETSWRVVDDFVNRLRELRSHPSHSTRPLVFVGHGFGGILIKHAVSNLINFGLGEDDFQNPVKLCVFFAVPNRGLKQEDDFASILEDLRALVLDHDTLSKPSLGLRRWNRSFANISEEFEKLRSQYDIEILTVVEKPEKEWKLVVPSHCASFQQAPGSSKTLDIGANHQDIAKLRQADDGASHALEMIRNAISRKLGKKRDHNTDLEPMRKENIYERLGNYDTFFLVDDSGSMEPHWKTTARVLAKIVSIAVKYDDDGVDVKFFNKHIEKNERTNLDTTEKVMQLFERNSPPRGGTLTADVLDEVLNDYMFRYHKDSYIKGLNLIILTDGEPDPEQDVEEVLKEYATQLREAGAHRFKVGVQFVQIGGDEKARAFLNYLDDELKAKHRLDRDMIDTVYWVEEDRDHLHEKILLGGILKRLDNEPSKQPP
ncbi:MAG: hypothetical protein Q9208_001884 [Pyrenodesmia sp. 3 TL-2023]